MLFHLGAHELVVNSFGKQLSPTFRADAVPVAHIKGSRDEILSSCEHRVEQGVSR